MQMILKTNTVLALSFVFVFFFGIRLAEGNEITSSDILYIRRHLSIPLADISDSDLKQALQEEYSSESSNSAFLINTLKTIDFGKNVFYNKSPQTSLQQNIISFYAKWLTNAIYSIGNKIAGGIGPNLTNIFISLSQISAELLRIRQIQDNNLAYPYYQLRKNGLNDIQAWSQIAAAIREKRYEDLEVSGMPTQFPTKIGGYSEKELERLHVYIMFVYNSFILAENEEPLKIRLKNFLITETPNFKNFLGPYNNPYTIKAGPNIKFNGNSNSKILFQLNEWIVLRRGEKKDRFYFSKAGGLFFNEKKITSDIPVTYSYSKEGDKIITSERIYISPSSPHKNYVFLKGCDLPEDIVDGKTALCWAFFLIDGKRNEMKTTFGGKYGPKNLVSWSPNEDYAIVMYIDGEYKGYCRVDLKSADSVCWAD